MTPITSFSPHQPNRSLSFFFFFLRLSWDRCQMWCWHQTPCKWTPYINCSKTKVYAMSGSSSSSVPLPADSPDSPLSSQSNDREIQALKRCVCTLEIENAHMLSKISKKPWVIIMISEYLLHWSFSGLVAWEERDELFDGSSSLSSPYQTWSPSTIVGSYVWLRMDSEPPWWWPSQSTLPSKSYLMQSSP